MVDSARFSVAIPNFNYADYLGETITSVLEQSLDSVEIHVSDNASTDGSVDVVSSFAERGVRLSLNRTNVGFAGNLDRAVQPTTGRFVMVLSSDDLMRPDALTTYDRVFNLLGDRADTSVVAASFDMIDSSGDTYGRIGPYAQMWSDRDVDQRLTAHLGCRVLSVGGPVLLRRALLSMRNPLPFLSTAYPRQLYERVEGYGGARLINPDKWFHWRLIAHADRVAFVDRELFAYRTHGRNQASQQQRQGALKHLVDEYAYTLDVTDEMLMAAGLSREQLVKAFLHNDIVERGFLELVAGNHRLARRTCVFGSATYPKEARRLWSHWLLRGATAAGGAGSAAARAAVVMTEKARRDNGRVAVTAQAPSAVT